jgi:hypothetical protein
MRARLLRPAPALLAALVALAAPAAASAASATARVAVGHGVRSVGVTRGGVHLYAAFYATPVVVTGLVRDDTGAPVAGVTVVLATQTGAGVTPVLLGTVTTGADGTFAYTTAPARSLLYLVHVDASPERGIAAATDAVPAHVGIGPRLTLTSPRAQASSRYRIAGLINLPSPRGTGRICLARIVRSKAHRLACVGPDDFGRFRFTVRHRRAGLYVYRVTFLPRDATRFLRTWLLLRVRVSAS